MIFIILLLIIILIVLLKENYYKFIPLKSHTGDITMNYEITDNKTSTPTSIKIRVI